MKQIELTVAQRDSLERRIAAKIRFECPPQDDLARPVVGPCWTWTGAVSHGYGSVWAQGKSVPTHRAMAAMVGVDTHEMPVDHLCRNTLCCNPDHLEPVTQRENCLRGLVARNLRIGKCAACGSADGFERASRGLVGTGWHCNQCTARKQKEKRHSAKRLEILARGMSKNRTGTERNWLSFVSEVLLRRPGSRGPMIKEGES